MINSHYLFLIRYAQFEVNYAAICDSLESLRMVEGTPDERNELLSETCAMCIDFIEDSEELLDLGSSSAPFLREKGHGDDEVMESLLDVCVLIKEKVAHVSRFNTAVVKATSDTGDSDAREVTNPFADLVGIEEPEEEPFVPRETVVPLEFEDEDTEEESGGDNPEGDEEETESGDETLEEEPGEETPTEETPEESKTEESASGETTEEKQSGEEPATTGEPKRKRKFRFGKKRGGE